MFGAPQNQAHGNTLLVYWVYCIASYLSDISKHESSGDDRRFKYICIECVIPEKKGRLTIELQFLLVLKGLAQLEHDATLAA
jgi:hypothetical protein